MTTQQTIVVAVLWVAVAGLLGLVLLLYRAVDRAYRQGDRARQGGLLPGAEAPPVEILTPAGIDFLAPLSLDSPYLLAFVSGECEECRELFDTFVDGGAETKPAALVLVDGKPFDRPVPEWAPVVVHAAAHPPDLQRGYGLTALPLVYVMQARTVLAVGAASTRAEIDRLLEESRRTASELSRSDHQTSLEHDPVRVVMAGSAQGPGRE